MNINKSVIVLYENDMWSVNQLPLSQDALLVTPDISRVNEFVQKFKYNMVLCVNFEDEVKQFRTQLGTKDFADVYLDWVNNYLTVNKMAEDYGISNSELFTNIIEEGKKQHQIKTKLFKYESKSSAAIGRVNLVIEEIDHLSKAEQDEIKLLTQKIVEIINNSQPEVI